MKNTFLRILQTLLRAVSVFCLTLAICELVSQLKGSEGEGVNGDEQ